MGEVPVAVRGGEQEGEGDAAAPDRGQVFFDDAEPLAGMDEAVRSGQDADVLGNGAPGTTARAHAEQEQRTGYRVTRRDLQYHPARTLGQYFPLPGLAQVAAIGRDRKGLGADHLAPGLPLLHCRQHFLNFLPLPHGQGSLRPTFGAACSKVSLKSCDSELSEACFVAAVLRDLATSTAVILAAWGALGGATNALTTQMRLRDALRHILPGGLIAAGMGAACRWRSSPAGSVCRQRQSRPGGGGRLRRLSGRRLRPRLYRGRPRPAAQRQGGRHRCMNFSALRAPSAAMPTIPARRSAIACASASLSPS